MQVSSAGASMQAAQAASNANLYSLLKAAQQAPAEMVETLLAVQVQNTAAQQKMEIAGQILDVYA